jgi:hypothetical protein
MDRQTDHRPLASAKRMRRLMSLALLPFPFCPETGRQRDALAETAIRRWIARHAKGDRLRAVAVVADTHDLSARPMNTTKDGREID